MADEGGIDEEESIPDWDEKVREVLVVRFIQKEKSEMEREDIT
jgi:hypothetical protein